MAAAPKPKPGEFLRVAPDFVVEILPTSTASRDRGEKRVIYDRSGVRELWLVDGSAEGGTSQTPNDSRAREILIFVREEHGFGREKVISDRERARATVLGGLEFDASEIFPE